MVEFLPLGVGSRTLETLRSLARERSLPLLAALEAHLGDKFGARPLLPLLRELRPAPGGDPGRRPPLRLLQASGYLEILEEKARRSACSTSPSCASSSAPGKGRIPAPRSATCSTA